MLSGSAAPSLAEQAYLSSNIVTVPANIYGAEQQITSTSIVLDVILGDDHPLATAYRKFCRTTWRSIKANLYAIEPGSSLPTLPLIMRWMQLELGAYFRPLSDNSFASPAKTSPGTPSICCPLYLHSTSPAPLDCQLHYHQLPRDPHLHPQQGAYSPQGFLPRFPPHCQHARPRHTYERVPGSPTHTRLSALNNSGRKLNKLCHRNQSRHQQTGSSMPFLPHQGQLF